MLWFALLQLAIITDSTSLGKSNSLTEVKENSLIEQNAELVYRLREKLYKDLLENFKSIYSRDQKSIRSKRSLNAQRPLLSDRTGAYSLHSIEQSVSICSPALKITFIDVDGITYVACVALRNGRNASANLGYLTKYPIQYHHLTSWDVNNPNDLVLFYDQGFIYILVSDSRQDGVDLVKYHLETASTTVDHTTNGNCPTSISVTKLKYDNTFHLLMANTNCERNDNFTSEVSSYIWKGNTYFDHYNSFRGYDVKDIAQFHIHEMSYLVVANYRRNGNYFTDSEIFKLSIGGNKWVSHQKIRTYKALDWEFFSLGHGIRRDFFLVVANSAENDLHGKIKPMIYKFEKDMFVPFQCLDILQATSVAAFTDSDKFILAVSNTNTIYLYQYDGWRFERAGIPFFELLSSTGIISLTFHHVLSNPAKIILAVSNSDLRSTEESLFELEFVKENYLQSWYDNTTEWCFNKLSDLHDLNVEDAIEMQKLFFVDQDEPIVLNGDLKFDAGLVASTLSTPMLMVSEVRYDSGILVKLNELKGRLEKFKNRIDDFEQLYSRALKKEGDQEIQASYEFHDAHFLCDRRLCQFHNLVTKKLNGDDVSELDKKLVFLDQANIIDGELYANTIMVENVTVHGKMDGVEAASIVTKSGNYVIDGHKSFTKPLKSKTVTVNGLFDSINFSRDEIFLLGSDQNIRGNFTFSEIRSNWLEVMEYLNDINLTNFYNEAVLISGTYNITGEKTFNNVVCSELRVNAGSTINGVDLKYLWPRVLWKTGYQEIQATMQFQSLSFESNLKVNGTINGIYIPGHRVLLTDGNATITAPQTFEKSTRIHRLAVRNSLNGISVDSQTGKLNILTKKGSQIITGKKEIKRIVLDNHSHVKGSIDGVILESLLNSIASNNVLNTDEPWTFNNLIAEEFLRVEGRVSGYHLEDIYEKALKLTDMPHWQNFVFQAPVSVGELYSQDMNGLNIRNDLVLTGIPQTITGKKIFHDIQLKDDSKVIGKLNNLNSSFLEHSLLRIGNQVITSKKAFNGNIKVKNLTVKGYVNGIDFDEIVPLDGAILSGLKFIEKSKFDDLEVDSMTVTGNVNGINLLEMMADTMTYDDSQTVVGRKYVTGALVFEGDSNLISKDLNSVNFKELFADAVLVDKDQLIEGKKIFSGPVCFDSLKVYGTIDGVSGWDMNNWLLQTTTQTVEDSVSFNNIEAKKVFVNGLINGMDILQLNNSIVYSNELSVLNGHVSFIGPVVAKGDISLSGTVQGIDLSEELSLLGNTVITGKKTFASDLFINTLSVDGMIDNTNISRICANYVSLHNNHTIEKLTIKGDVTFESDGYVGGRISGIDISTLYETAISQNGEYFDGLKTFQSLTIEGNFQVMGLLNGVDVSSIGARYMSLSRPQNVAAHQFEELYVYGNLYAKNLHTVDQMVSGLDMKYINENAMRTFGQQTITADQKYSRVTFEDDVVVVGKVNGIEIPRGLMRKSRTNYIRGTKVFTETVRILGNLDLEERKTIEGIDLSSWLSEAVRKNGSSYLIRGSKTFLDVSMNDMRVHGLLDGVNISEKSLLLSYGDQLITGAKTMKHFNSYGDLVISGNINGINLEDLRKSAIYKDNATISAVKTFVTPLNVKYLEADEIDGVKIDDMINLVKTEWPFRTNELKLQEIEKISDISISRKTTSLHYELFQLIDVIGCHSLSYISTVNSDFILLSEYVNDACANIRIFEFSNKAEKFQIRKEHFPSSNTAAINVLNAWNYTFLIIGNSKSSSRCSDEQNVDDTTISSPIYFYEAQENQFLKYQDIATGPIVDIVSFTVNARACIVAVELQQVVLFCAKDMVHDFLLHETLPTTGGIKASILQIKQDVILTIATVDSQSSLRQFVDVYFWNKRTFGLPTSLRAMNVEDVLLISRPHDRIDQVYLLVAEDSFFEINGSPRILVYKLNENNFYKYQEIDDGGKLDSVISQTGEMLLFVLNKRANRINVYQHKGVSGFVRTDSIRNVGATSLHAFTRNNSESDWNDYIALSGFPRSDSSFKGTEQVKILASKRKGRTQTERS